LNRNTYNTTHTTNNSRSMSTNFHTDSEMTDYQQPRSSPIGNSVARSRALTKTGRTPKSRVKPMGPLRIRQTPLPAHLSPQQILEKFPGRLYYNDLLKVALQYDNRRITDRVSRDSPTTGVCQRIAAATDWIESEFKTSRGAFHIAFDRECCRNGVNRFNYYDVPSEEKRHSQLTQPKSVKQWHGLRAADLVLFLLLYHPHMVHLSTLQTPALNKNTNHNPYSTIPHL
jgi:hypothetical protein